MEQAEKKTAEPEQTRHTSPSSTETPLFLTLGGTAQCRYERLRSYMLVEPACRPRVSPAQFDLRRFHRYGLLGLVDHQPLRRGWDEASRCAFEIELIPIEAADAPDRLARLCELLAATVSKPQGGEDATSGAVCQGLDRLAGEGADDPEPARRHYALR